VIYVDPLRHRDRLSEVDEPNASLAAVMNKQQRASDQLKNYFELSLKR